VPYSYVYYTGDGTTTNYAFSFPYIDQDHISVKVDGSAVSFSFLNSSTVQLASAPASSTTVEIRRETPKDAALVDFTDGSALLESDLDLLSLFNLYTAQEVDDAVGQTIAQNTSGIFDAQNRRISNVADPVDAQDATTKSWIEATYTSAINSTAASAAAAATSATNAATSATNASNSATSASTSASGAATSATNASTSATSAASSASAASTSATNAATSASSAATSATSATSSASNASTSATNAASSATNAASSETAAATSETNAANSATAAASSATSAASSASAAAAYADNFDDAYLGAKASNPSVDNDGDALQDGALYFDTTNNVMKVYDLGNTTWYQLTPTVSNQTNINTVAGIAADVTAVAGDAADIGVVSGLSSDIQLLADLEDGTTLTSGLSNLAGINSEIVTAANNIVDISNFGDIWYGPSASAPSTRADGSALQAGDMYFNTTDNSAKVYDGTGFISMGSTVNGTADRFKYVATASQTTFSGADANGNTLAYDAGYIDVYLNGVHLDPSDYTATSGTSIVLASGAAVNDELYVVAFGTFTLNSTVIDDITDVTVTSVTDNEVMAYDSGTSKWINQTAAEAGLATVADTVAKTAATGSGALPSGTTAQRDGSPSAGYIRFNSDLTSFEGYNGSAWGSIGGGASGGGSDGVFYENDQTVTTNYTLTSNKNAMSTGPITINSGVTVTIPTGSRWVVI